ncbi:MAG: T9SS type A sorting domain-containing protein, partial [Calditrichaceae bacterium]
TDNFNVQSASLWYGQGGTSIFTSYTMMANGNTYSGVIPGNVVGSQGIKYYITAADADGNNSVSGKYSLPVAISDPGIENGTAQPAGKEQSAYRLFSIPINANNKSPSNILNDDLGSYDKTKWRFFELKPDQPDDNPYKEYPNTSNMEPGNAFWLIVKDAGKKIDTGSGVTELINEEYKISLNAGWTLIGNPFNFDIPYDHISMENKAVLDIRSYTGDWNFYSGVLKPFEGYAVHADSATNLVIDPDLSNLAKTIQPKLVLQVDDVLWSINISARCEDATDKNNQILIHKNATQNWDEFDRAEPPVIGEYVSVYFDHPEWKKISSRYCIDARPGPFEGDMWELNVETNIKDEVFLKFEGIKDIPSQYEIRLIDEKLRIVQNLKTSDRYKFAASSVKQPKSLKILIGDQIFIANELNKLDLLPQSFVLEQNFPNPFNPVTTIRFGIPSEQKVTLKIYNVLGQEIKTLSNDVYLNAGYHTVIWDGKNSHNELVASGIYIYTLKTDNFDAVKKMILVR